MSDLSWIENYVYTFAKRWKPYLDEHLELRAEVHVGNRRGMIAIEFFPADKTDPWELNPKNDSWQYIVEQVGKALPQPMETSQILMDGIVYVVTDEAVTVIKRNEKHLWTRSLAREDAEATLCKRMIDSSCASDQILRISEKPRGSDSGEDNRTGDVMSIKRSD